MINNLKSSVVVAVGAASIGFIGLNAQAAYVLETPGVAVIETFDDSELDMTEPDGYLGTSGIYGEWTFTGSSNFRGRQNGGSATNGIRAFGVNDGTDWAPGVIPNDNNELIGVAAYSNGTGQTLQSLVVAYDAEQWRRVDVDRVNGIDVYYSLDGVNYTAIPELEFVAERGPTASGLISTTALSAEIDVELAPDALVYLRFHANTGGTLNSTTLGQGVAFDNVSVTGIVPEPGSLGLLGLGCALLGIRRRRVTQ